ncbi:MAG: glycoside hydrolase family 5 protein [Halanaerobiales bacterium]
MINGYYVGVNLGGWISQYGNKGKEHYQSFITEEDIKRIAGWGMDHVRLPVDYPVLEDDDNPFVYKESGFSYIDNCLEWCDNNNLNVILDLHKAPGYSFGSLDENSLFENPEMRKRFISLWKYITERYSSQGENLILELLNEMVEPDSKRWNKLAHETIAAIRDIDSKRKIIYGGNRYNSVSELKNIKLLDDPNVIYTFHFYHPHLFTHQKAGWSEMAMDYNQTIEYPGKFTNLDRFIAEHPRYKGWADRNRGIEINKEMLWEDMQPAVDFLKESGRELYCGEFGVIDHTPIESRVRWHRDFIDILNELKIGRAVWTYKGMNFALVDLDGNVVSQELIDIVSKGD